MRGLKTDRTASAVIRGHAFIQNQWRGHYELSGDAPSRHLRVAAAFDELADAIGASAVPLPARRASRSLNATVPGAYTPGPRGRGLPSSFRAGASRLRPRAGSSFRREKAGPGAQRLL